ncbi:MAG TPA: hypothetical protein VEL51_22140 [Vicinamibacterales bacterium]|nr:hypothetical protein [Vicinamibacterales bacterium]
MIRSLGLTVCVLLAGAILALSQTHPPEHAQSRTHDHSGHIALDPAQHAAIHARLLGNWTGTSSFPGAVSRKLDLAVGHDKLGNVTLEMTAEPTVRVGAASKVAIDGGTLHWTQAVAGSECQATAVVKAPTALRPETLKGTMACEQGEVTFALRKTKG